VFDVGGTDFFSFKCTAKNGHEKLLDLLLREKRNITEKADLFYDERSDYKTENYDIYGFDYSESSLFYYVMHDYLIHDQNFQLLTYFMKTDEGKVELLRKNYDNDTFLHKAVEKYDEKLVILILENVADFSSLNIDGRLPLDGFDASSISCLEFGESNRSCSLNSCQVNPGRNFTSSRMCEGAGNTNMGDGGTNFVCDLDFSFSSCPVFIFKNGVCVCECEMEETSCPAGFYLNTDNGDCEPKKCFCENGPGA